MKKTDFIPELCMQTYDFLFCADPENGLAEGFYRNDFRLAACRGEKVADTVKQIAPEDAVCMDEWLHTYFQAVLGEQECDEMLALLCVDAVWEKLQEADQLDYDYSVVGMEAQTDGALRRKRISVTRGADALVYSCMDITQYDRKERKRAELLRQASDLAMELSGTGEKLLLSLSQEIRKPLAQMQALLRQETHAESDWETARAYASELEHKVGAMLDASSALRTEQYLEQGIVYIPGLLSELRDLLADAFAQKKMQYSFEVSDAYPAVRTDPSFVRQLLWQPLVNAVTYGKEGGHVHVAVRVENMPVDDFFMEPSADTEKNERIKEFAIYRSEKDEWGLEDADFVNGEWRPGKKPLKKKKTFGTYKPQRRMMVICMTDDGPGIPADKSEKIFCPFEGENAEHAVTGGLGLGLYTVQCIADKMQGEVQFTSGEGENRLMIRVPVLSAGAGEAAYAQHVSEKGRNFPELDFTGIHILVVDHDPQIRELVAHKLQSYGLVTDTACSGAEAVGLLRNSENGYYRMVFFNPDMPNGSGFKMTCIMRDCARDDLADLTFAAYTLHDSSQQRLRCYYCGIDIYLPLPFDEHDLRKELIADLFEQFPEEAHEKIGLHVVK